MTQEELMQLYAQGGIDPTMADMSTAFYAANGPGQNQGAQVAAGPRAYMGTSPYDMSANVQQMSLDSVSRNVEQLTRSVDRLIGTMGQQTNQTDMTIRNLAQLQQQTYQQISAQQFSVSRAQMMSPQSFPYAPGIAYQTDPGSAIYRQSLGSNMPTIAAGPSSSFFTDVALSNSFFRKNFYEPSFAEDPFMSIYGASQRNQERFDTLGRYAGSAAAGLGGMAVSGLAYGAIAGRIRAASPAIAAGEKAMMGGLMRGGLRAGIGKGAMRFGMGLVPGVGGAVMMGDMALDMMGLPSVGGTITDAVTGAYNYTLGSGYAFNDMVKDVQKSTSFYTGAGAGLTGQGLGARSAGNMVKGLRGLSTKDYALNMNDYMGIFQSMGENGLLAQSGSDEQMLSAVRTVSKNLRLFMRVSGDPDYKNAIKSMGDLFRMGVPMQHLSGAVENVQAFSRMAGLNYQQSETFGKQGALMYQQAGASLGVGYQAGVFSRAMSRMATQAGQFSPGFLAYHGGEEGIAQMLTGIQGSIMGGPVMQSLTAGMLKVGKGGKLEIDKAIVDQSNAGTMSIQDLQLRARTILNDPKRMAEYQLRQKELGISASEMMGPEGAILTQLNIIKEIQRRNPNMDLNAATLTAFGGNADQASVFLKTVDPKVLQAQIASEKNQRYQLQYNRNQNIMAANTPFNKIRVAMQEALYNNIGRSFEESNRKEAVARERARAIDLGLVPGNIVSEAYGAADEQFLKAQGEGEYLAGTVGRAQGLAQGALSFASAIRDQKLEADLYAKSGLQEDVTKGGLGTTIFRNRVTDNLDYNQTAGIKQTVLRHLKRKNPTLFEGLSGAKLKSMENVLFRNFLESAKNNATGAEADFYDRAQASVVGTTQSEALKFTKEKGGELASFRELVQQLDPTAAGRYKKMQDQMGTAPLPYGASRFIDDPALKLAEGKASAYLDLMKSGGSAAIGRVHDKLKELGIDDISLATKAYITGTAIGDTQKISESGMSIDLPFGLGKSGFSTKGSGRTALQKRTEEQFLKSFTPGQLEKIPGKTLAEKQEFIRSNLLSERGTGDSQNYVETVLKGTSLEEAASGYKITAKTAAGQQAQIDALNPVNATAGSNLSGSEQILKALEAVDPNKVLSAAATQQKLTAMDQAGYSAADKQVLLLTNIDKSLMSIAGVTEKSEVQGPISFNSETGKPANIEEPNWFQRNILGK